jgi:hypothetical protein
MRARTHAIVCIKKQVGIGSQVTEIPHNREAIIIHITEYRDFHLIIFLKMAVMLHADSRTDFSLSSGDQSNAE